MSEVVSFGNLVNALNSVRDDYHEHLKSVPQYEAFLLVESSNRKVFETLHGLIDSPAPSMAAEVISALEIAKTKFKQHLKSVAEYRALLAIDKLISDVSIDLGVVRPALAQIVPPTVEHEIPAPVHAFTQPVAAEVASTEQVAATLAEPDLAVSASEHTVTQPEAPEFSSTRQIVATEPEPDRAELVSAHTVAPEAAEGTSTDPMAAAQPEPDLALPAFEHTLALATEIASNHAMAQPELDLAALEHAITRPGLAEIVYASSTSPAQNEHSGAPIPATEGAAPGEPPGNQDDAAIKDMYNFVEPPAAALDEGEEKAA